MNLRREHDNDRDGDGGDAVEASEGVNAYAHSSRMNEDDFKNGIHILDDKRPFKQTASYQDL